MSNPQERMQRNLAAKANEGHKTIKARVVDGALFAQIGLEGSSSAPQIGWPSPQETSSRSKRPCFEYLVDLTADRGKSNFSCPLCFIIQSSFRVHR